MLTKRNTQKINLPLWDPYFEKEVLVQGNKTIFPQPILWNSIQYKSFHVCFLDEQEEIVIRTGSDRIEMNELLQIADIFDVKDFQINRSRKNYVYLCTGSKSFWWVNNNTEHKSMPCKLNYDEVYCSGYTVIPNEESEPNLIMHTVLESEL